MPSKAKVVKQTAEEAVVPQQVNEKQAVKDSIFQHISEIEAARNDTGEDDPKAQSLIEKFKGGKKLTADEMAYIRKHAPGMVEYIDRIMKEREVLELSMKMAPSKSDVQMVAFRAAQNIEKHYSGEEAEIRSKHLVDAKQQYEKTDEYKEKPNSPLDRQKKKIKLNFAQNEQQTRIIAKAAYEGVRKMTKQKPVQSEEV